MKLSHRLKNALESALGTIESRDEIANALEAPGSYTTVTGRQVNIDCKLNIGAAGAVSSVSGSGLTSAVQLATGIYEILLADVHSALVQASGHVESPIGATVTAGSFVVGSLYQILTVGTTDWTVAGLNDGGLVTFTPAVGQMFCAIDEGTGNGTVKEILLSGAAAVEVAAPTSAMLSNSSGSMFVVQVVDAAGALVAPVSGSSINLRLVVSDVDATIN